MSSFYPIHPQHIRFYCVLLHNHELSIYILCRFVILGEEHGYSPHTDILKHGNSSRIINKTPLQSSIALHSTQNATHHTTPLHTLQYTPHTLHTTRLEYTASVLTKRIIYETRFFFVVFLSPVSYSSSSSDALLCTCIGKHKQFKTRRKDKQERKNRKQRKQPKKPKLNETRESEE
jgi:hypothetical protein